MNFSPSATVEESHDSIIDCNKFLPSDFAKFPYSSALCQYAVMGEITQNSFQKQNKVSIQTK